jgi:hypothetical protein
MSPSPQDRSFPGSWFSSVGWVSFHIRSFNCFGFDEKSTLILMVPWQVHHRCERHVPCLFSFSCPPPLCKSSTDFPESSVLVLGSFIWVSSTHKILHWRLLLIKKVRLIYILVVLLFHLGLLNSQYSSLEAALDQAGLIDLYFSCFSRSLSVKELSSAFDLPLWMQPVEALGELV